MHLIGRLVLTAGCALIGGDLSIGLDGSADSTAAYGLPHLTQHEEGVGAATGEAGGELGLEGRRVGESVLSMEKEEASMEL